MNKKILKTITIKKQDIYAKFLTQGSVYGGYLTNTGTDKSWGPIITDWQFNEQTGEWQGALVLREVSGMLQE